MGALYTSVQEELLASLRTDNPENLKNILQKYKVDIETLFTSRKRTLLQLAAYYGSDKCFKELVQLGSDINKKEYQNNNTPLFIASKFGYDKIVKFLLELKDDVTYGGAPLKILELNNEGFNEFEIAFLKGNYNVCYYFLYGDPTSSPSRRHGSGLSSLEINNKGYDNVSINEKDNLKRNKCYELREQKEFFSKYQDGSDVRFKTNDNLQINKLKNPITEYQKNYANFFNKNPLFLEKYSSICEQFKYPLFNMRKFYYCLKEGKEPSQCPSFGLERKRLKKYEGKIPDPNESWGHFFGRLAKFELYEPPLVDKDSVGPMNSLYMRMQSSLLNIEYGADIDCSNNYRSVSNTEEKDRVNNSNNINNINNMQDKRTEINSENCKRNEIINNSGDNKNKILNINKKIKNLDNISDFRENENINMEEIDINGNNYANSNEEFKKENNKTDIKSDLSNKNNLNDIVNSSKNKLEKENVNDKNFNIEDTYKSNNIENNNKNNDNSLNIESINSENIEHIVSNDDKLKNES